MSPWHNHETASLACPSAGEQTLSVVAAPELQVGGTVEMRCCIDQLCSDPLTLTYIPEPHGSLMLLMGAAAVAMLPRRTR